MQHSPSVTTATSCSAPSGVTAPAMLVKGRPVPCPGSPRLSPAWPEGALPDAYCHSLGPPLGPPGLKSLLLPPAQPAWVSPSPHPPVASAPPPTPGKEAGSDGWHYQGSFPRALYLAASASSLPATGGWGERRRGSQAPQKELPRRKLGLRHSAGGREKRVKPRGTPRSELQHPEHCATEEVPAPPPKPHLPTQSPPYSPTRSPRGPAGRGLQGTRSRDTQADTSQRDTQMHHTSRCTHTRACARVGTCCAPPNQQATMLPPRYGSAVSKRSRSPPVPETQLPFLSLLVLRAWKRTIPFSVPSWLHHLSPAALLLSSMAWLFSPPQFSPFCPSFRFPFLFLPLLTSSFLPSLCPLLPPHKPFPSGSPPASPSSLRLSLCSRGDMTSRASKSHISTKSYLQPSEGCVHPDTQTLSHAQR